MVSTSVAVGFDQLMKSPVPEKDATQSKRSGELLHAIIQGTVAVTGTEFFRSLVRHLAQGLHVRWVFVAECLPNLRARSLAFWHRCAGAPPTSHCW